jgi:hypothetical protein
MGDMTDVLVWLALLVATALLSAELIGWLPVLQRAMIRAVTKKLPTQVRGRYEEEWQGVLKAMPDAPLSRFVFVTSLLSRRRAISKAIPQAPKKRVATRKRGARISLMRVLAAYMAFPARPTQFRPYSSDESRRLSIERWEARLARIGVGEYKKLSPHWFMKILVISATEFDERHKRS